ncbi:unnamed protein product [Darwinula stevensoni]|uniref:Sushi domain-containing protein n=1 Tax=Darwinula stevensoni TaxID=69355 RepID=A0A7R8XBI1_9CRUS|nr:unnamed protein product [Darwinula stevensoni]CAG0892877.1 unnamed protein product [Darwinula stevensoni]
MLVKASAESNKCEVVQEVEDYGMISQKTFQESLCDQVLITPKDQKLAFNFVQAKLLDGERLLLLYNGERLEVNESCALCLGMIVTEKLTIRVLVPPSLEAERDSRSTTSIPENPSVSEIRFGNLSYEFDIHDVMINDINSGIKSNFTILYRVFNPDRCKSPEPPSEGRVVGKDHRLGGKVQFVCDPPYDMVGESGSVCQTSDAGIPEWSDANGKCEVICQVEPLIRRMESGAIMNPEKNEEQSVCKWKIQTDNDNGLVSWIHIEFKYLDLKNGSLSVLPLRDGIGGRYEELTWKVRGRPETLVIPARELLVEFQSLHSQDEFYISYNLTAGDCILPDVDHGTWENMTEAMHPVTEGTVSNISLVLEEEAIIDGGNSDRAPASLLDMEIMESVDEDSFFEGTEKLLEVWFTRKDGQVADCDLRTIPRGRWESLLELARCEIVSMCHNDAIDAYVLSESSMFVSKQRFILKTCGTTTLLWCMQHLLRLVSQYAGFDTVQDMFYSRKNFTRPELQPQPHNNFQEEVSVLDQLFPGKKFGDWPHSSVVSVSVTFL